MDVVVVGAGPAGVFAARRAAGARFDPTARTIIDGRTDGFCKLIVDRSTAMILGCHVVGWPVED